MGSVTIANLFHGLPLHAAGEVVTTLAESPGVRIERIVSSGQATPEGEWYDQEHDEWVLLLAGGAGLLFEGEQEPRPLVPGDSLLIPARCRHRVAWTTVGVNTVWLTVHCGR